MENFNSLPHAEVDLKKLEIRKEDGEFQLTTSRRGRPGISQRSMGTNVFQLTTSRRGRHRSQRQAIESSVFQLTTSRRGRHVITQQREILIVISTHYLTQR